MARDALTDGNDGKARVCARRAVGKAFQDSRYRTRFPSAQSTPQILKAISGSEVFPPDVREIAERLAASVAENNGLLVSSHPVEDAVGLIIYLLEE